MNETNTTGNPDPDLEPSPVSDERLNAEYHAGAYSEAQAPEPEPAAQPLPEGLTLRRRCGDRFIQGYGKPGPGGAFVRYDVLKETDAGNEPPDLEFIARVKFQPDVVSKVGVVGLTNEALLAIVANRLACFQHGPFACPENRAALEHVEKAIGTLEERTASRQRRGVEGTHAV